MRQMFEFFKNRFKKRLSIPYQVAVLEDKLYQRDEIHSEKKC